MEFINIGKIQTPEDFFEVRNTILKLFNSNDKENWIKLLTFKNIVFIEKNPYSFDIINTEDKHYCIYIDNTNIINDKLESIIPSFVDGTAKEIPIMEVDTENLNNVFVVNDKFYKYEKEEH